MMERYVDGQSAAGHFLSVLNRNVARSQAGSLFSVHPKRNLNLNGRSWSFIVGRGDTEVRDGARQ